MNDVIANLHQMGFAWVRRGIAESDGAFFKQCFDSGEGTRRAGARVPQARLPELETRIKALPWAACLPALLSGEPVLLRAIAFEKSLDAPWHVAWHRDRMVPVAEHVPGAVGASVKADVPHVRAHHATLAKMLAVRVHLDPADAENGALRVMPGSHRTAEDDDVPPGHEVLCTADVGDVLLMRPLLLHRSEKPAGPARRRVLHLEWRGPYSLPAGLRWAR